MTDDPAPAGKRPRHLHRVLGLGFGLAIGVIAADPISGLFMLGMISLSVPIALLLRRGRAAMSPA